MNRQQLSLFLRSAADSIDALPEFARPFSASSDCSRMRIQIPYEDFERIFTHGKSKIVGDTQHVSTIDESGIEWVACRQIEREVSEWRPSKVVGVIGDGGDDELALAPREVPAAHAACGG